MIKSISIFLMIILFPVLSFQQTWIQTLNGRNVWSLAQDHQQNIYAGGLTNSNSRIWKSTNGGYSWDTIFIGAGQTMWDFGFDASGSVYAANFSNGLLKSTNNGQNFNLIPLSVFNNKNLQGVECGSGGYVFVTTSSGFFRSTDFGHTFIETALTGLNCLPVLVDKDSSNIVYVGVSSAAGTGIGFYRSTDFGETFSINLNPGKNGYNLYQRFSGELYMITTTSPYNFDVSTNKGLTWTTTGNMPQAQRGITVSSLNNVYTSGNGGVFRTSNGGQTFENFNFTTSATPILSYTFIAIVNLAVGTSGSSTGGVWIYTEGVIQSVAVNNENASGYMLKQNYPNPFNPSTQLEFGISNLGSVSLKIYDVLGIEIATLVNEIKPSGNYSVEWDASDYPGGVYFYKLQAGNLTETKKMLLIK